ncbi:MAG: GtrA family protein [Clostridiales bacterium]|nr:GtrA family protein [Clostridiales bacterium]
MIIIMDIFDKIFNLPLIRIIYPFYKKYKGIFLYLFFGALTTLVSIFSFVFCEKVIGLDIMTTNVISWVLAVSFAYFTNKKWVFNSSVKGGGALKEAALFAGARVATLVIEEILLLVFAVVLKFNSVGVKVCAQFAVLVLNYIFSKIVVFRKGKSK